MRHAVPAAALLALAACATGTGGAPPATAARPAESYDVIVGHGTIVDGTGNPWFRGDVGIRGGRIERVTPSGMLDNARAVRRIDATGLVVAPGFIDIQAQSYDSFLGGDSRVASMITQGITTAILGEGNTPAPLSTAAWTALAASDTATARITKPFIGTHGFARWLDAMASHRMAQNVGSFVGAGTVRVYAKGYAQGAPTAAELDTMRAVVRAAMQDGAFGIGSALIYPPNSYITTNELIEEAKVMSPFGGVYITHMRSEGDHYLEAIDEAITIGARGNVPVEIYHLKAAGVRNWGKALPAIQKIDSARAAGLDVAADMYAYVAGATSLASCIPPWASENDKLLDNVRNAATRARITKEMAEPFADWESLCQLATPAGVEVVGFTRPELKKYEGMRLAAIADALHKNWIDALIDITIAERAQTGALFFIADEKNLALQMKQPWLKFGTDAGGIDPDSATGMTHPRAYGNYPRILGKYVREEHVLTLEDAVRKMTSAVADRLSLRDRGQVRAGMWADLAIFNPKTITDRATYEKPHQLSTGMEYVLVNGVPVVDGGRVTGSRPGVIVRGPGYAR